MFVRVLTAAVLTLCALGAENLHVSGDKLREHVKYLAADRLEAEVTVGDLSFQLSLDVL